MMGFELGVVRQSGVQPTLEIGTKKWSSEGQAEKVLQRFPEALDDGDGAGFADGSKSLSDALGTKPTTKNSGGKLRSLVGYEVTGLAVMPNRLAD
jgi:hypothetical protein